MTEGMTSGGIDWTTVRFQGGIPGITGGTWEVYPDPKPGWDEKWRCEHLAARAGAVRWKEAQRGNFINLNMWTFMK